MIIEKVKEEGVNKIYRENKFQVIQEIIKKGIWPTQD